MLSTASQQLIRDLKAGKPVLLPLRKSFSTTGRGISRGERLELATSVLDWLTTTTQAKCFDTFLEALQSLRTLVPYMKTKSKSTVDTTASVERYCVNYGLSLSSKTHKQISTSFLKESLKLIFNGRRGGTQLLRKGAPKKQNPTKTMEKENMNPKYGEEEREIAECVSLLLFREARQLSLEDLLPMQDSVVTATTITGAMTIRLTSCEEKFTLRQLLSLANRVVLPWIDYLNSFKDESIKRTAGAYSSRISRFLLLQCQTTVGDVFDVFKLRVFAIKLGELKLNRYTRDLLQSANCLMRNTRLSAAEQLLATDMVRESYEDALHFLSKFERNDSKWIHEDVSAWMDSFLSVLSKRNPIQRIPEIFLNRLSSHRRDTPSTYLTRCLSLQVDLYNAGALSREITLREKGEVRTFIPRVWDKIGVALGHSGFTKDALEAEIIPVICAGSKKGTDAGLEFLRLLRTLEPIRQVIVTVPKDQSPLPSAAECILRLYLITVLRGLRSLSENCESTEPLDITEEVFTRLQKMVGGAMQASRNLLRHYWDSSNPDAFGVVFKYTSEVLLHHHSFCEDSAKKWRNWTFIPILAQFEKQLEVSSYRTCEEREEALERIGQIAEVCISSPHANAHQEQGVSFELASLFQVARQAYACLQKWSKLATISLRWLSWHASFTSRKEGHAPEACEVAKTFAQDIVKSVLMKEGLPDIESIGVSLEFVLSVVLDYSWWLSVTLTEFKSIERLDRLRYGLRMTRRFIVQRTTTNANSCLVRHIHLIWGKFSFEESGCNSGEAIDKARSMVTKCAGHRSTGFFEPRLPGLKYNCASVTNTFIVELLHSWKATVEKRFSDGEGHISNMLRILESHPDLLECQELKILCSEVLEWVAINFSLHSYDICASRTLELIRCLGIVSDKGEMESPLSKIIELLSEAPVTAKCLDSMRHCFRHSCSSDLMSEVCNAIKDFKAVLFHLGSMRRGKREVRYKSVPCSIAGQDLDIGFELKSEYGKRSIINILQLGHILLRMAMSLLAMENMGDSKYYMERCVFVFSQCLPATNFHFRVIRSMYQSICAPETHHEFKVEEKMEAIITKSRESTNNLISPSSILAAMVGISKSMLDVELARFQSHSKDKVELPIMALLDTCDELVKGDRSTKPIDDNVLADEIVLMRAIAHAALGKYERALPLINHFSSPEGHISSGLVAVALFYTAWCYVHSANGIDAVLDDNRTGIARRAGNEKVKTRVTRSQAKEMRNGPLKSTCDGETHVLNKIRTVLNLAERGDIWRTGQPWIWRHLLSLNGFLHADPTWQICQAGLSIGTSYNIRQRYARYLQCSRTPDTLKSSECSVGDSDAFQQSSFSSSSTSRKHLDDIKDWLCHKKSVLVGLSIDERKQRLLIWRISETGKISKICKIPDSGPKSFQGALSRMQNIMSGIKQGAAKPGQKFSKNEKVAWWERMLDLNEQMRCVLNDIETEWLGEVGCALLAPTVSTSWNETAKETGSKGRGKSKSQKKATRSNVQEEDSSDDLVKALQELSIQNEGGQDNDSNLGSTKEENKIGNLILLTDTILERIPWESLPCLRDLNVTASRIPSLAFLYQYMKEPTQEIDARKVFYVINPAGDLQRTQKHFQEVIDQNSDWVGFQGCVKPEDVTAKYADEEVYLYCGHGSGGLYFPPYRLCRKKVAPVALLMGCSSLRPLNFGTGDQESNGTGISFLEYGSKAVVGNLWDVTDGEMDRLTTSILRGWIGINKDGSRREKRLSLAAALAESRPKCILPYLVGAACVVVGVPHLYAVV